MYGDSQLAIEDVAGLARVALARSERGEEANGYAEECLAHIAAHGVTGIEYPFEVYLTCARVLKAYGERKRARRALAQDRSIVALKMSGRCTVRSIVKVLEYGFGVHASVGYV